MRIRRNLMLSRIDDTDDEPNQSSVRVKSTIAFPYYDLNSVLSLPRAIHENFGSRCSPDQLAAILNHENARSGSFGLKTAAGQQFGLITRDKSNFAITHLGLSVLHKESEVQAKIAAFLEVPLFKKVYERYKGLTLPGDLGLEMEMVEMGVTHKSADRARQVFQRSAEQAGLFWLGRNRIVLPKGVSDSWIANQTQSTDNNELESTSLSLSSSQSAEVQMDISPSSRPTGIEGLPPAVIGVLTTLPPPGTAWQKVDIDAWSEMFRQVLMISYGVKS